MTPPAIASISCVADLDTSNDEVDETPRNIPDAILTEFARLEALEDHCPHHIPGPSIPEFTILARANQLLLTSLLEDYPDDLRSPTPFRRLLPSLRLSEPAYKRTQRDDTA